MPDIRQIALDESSPNPCQTILRLVEMILLLCLVLMNDTVRMLNKDNGCFQCFGFELLIDDYK